MRGLPPELIYVLLFIGVLLFQYLMKRRPRRESQEPLPEDQDAHGLPVDPDSAWVLEQATPVTWSPSPVPAEPPGRPQAPATARTRPHGRFSRQSLMRTRRDVQNAVVIATILGPCRALEPPASEAAAPSPRRAARSSREPEGA
jgi:hypothetical protein